MKFVLLTKNSSHLWEVVRVQESLFDNFPSLLHLRVGNQTKYLSSDLVYKQYERVQNENN